VVFDSRVQVFKVFRVYFDVIALHRLQRQQSREVTVSLAILNLAELSLHPRPCPRYSLFLC